jgi:hypothetical protein
MFRPAAASRPVQTATGRERANLSFSHWPGRRRRSVAAALYGVKEGSSYAGISACGGAGRLRLINHRLFPLSCCQDGPKLSLNPLIGESSAAMGNWRLHLGLRTAVSIPSSGNRLLQLEPVIKWEKIVIVSQSLHQGIVCCNLHAAEPVLPLHHVSIPSSGNRLLQHLYCPRDLGDE